MSVKLQLQNKIINGGMDYWQRNTTFAAIANNTYCADRFHYIKTGAMVHTISRSADVPSSSSSLYSLLIDCTTVDASIAAGDYSGILQRIEGNVLRSFKGKKMVLTFWVKATKTGVYCVTVRNGAANRAYVMEYTVNASNTWEKKAVRFQHDTAGTWTYDNSVGIIVAWILASGSTYNTVANSWVSGNYLATSNQVNACDDIANNFQLADVCLVEDNEGATRDPEFQLAGRDLFEELQLCQRYYNKSYEIGTPPATATSVNEYVFWCPTAVSTRHYFNFPVPMRGFPALSFWSRIPVAGQWIDTASVARSVDSSNASTHGFSMDVTPGAVNRYVLGHYAADAEL